MILDIDDYHGNGTQDIFWERSDVMLVSLHADPRTDFPFYWVHTDKCGEGEGEGSTLNFPLPRGTAVGAHRKELAKALPAIAAFEPEILLVSFGADTFADDPISFFEMQTADYLVIANEIKALELPTAIIMEGGYAVGELGENTASFLSPFL